MRYCEGRKVEKKTSWVSFRLTQERKREHWRSCSKRTKSKGQTSLDECHYNYAFVVCDTCSYFPASQWFFFFIFLNGWGRMWRKVWSRKERPDQWRCTHHHCWRSYNSLNSDLDMGRYLSFHYSRSILLLLSKQTWLQKHKKKNRKQKGVVDWLSTLQLQLLQRNCGVISCVTSTFYGPFTLRNFSGMEIGMQLDHSCSFLCYLKFQL